MKFSDMKVNGTYYMVKKEVSVNPISTEPAKTIDIDGVRYVEQKPSRMSYNYVITEFTLLGVIVKTGICRKDSAPWDDYDVEDEYFFSHFKFGVTQSEFGNLTDSSEFFETKEEAVERAESLSAKEREKNLTSSVKFIAE